MYADLAFGPRWTKTHESTPIDTTLTSTDVRIKLGAAFKPAPRWTIVAYLWGALGNYGSLHYTTRAGEQDYDIDSKTTHRFFGIGAGVFYDLPIGKQ